MHGALSSMKILLLETFIEKCKVLQRLNVGMYRCNYYDSMIVASIHPHAIIYCTIFQNIQTSIGLKVQDTLISKRGEE